MTAINEEKATVAPMANANLSLKLFDRAKLVFNLRAEIERVKRYKRLAAMLFATIDEFDTLSATYGQVISDMVMTAVLNTVQRNMRKTDSVYQYGHSEFASLLPEADAAAAQKAAHNIHQAIQKIPVQNIHRSLAVPLSVHICIIDCNVINDKVIDQFFEFADKTFFTIKNTNSAHVLHYSDLLKNDQAQKPVVLPPEKTEKKRIVFNGLSLSGGYALGKAFIYEDIISRDKLLYSISEKNIDHELQRINSAVAHVIQDLSTMTKLVQFDLGKQSAGIFEAFQEILKDKGLNRDFESELKKELINAEQIVKNVFRKRANRFRNSESSIIKTRAEDIEDLGRKVIRVLLGYEKNVLTQLPPDSIVVAQRLSPFDTIHLNRNNVKGILVKQGSINSHSAILARTIGIPALCNVTPSFVIIKSGEDIIIDGKTSTMILNPLAEDKIRYQSLIETNNKHTLDVMQAANEIAHTKDGITISVQGNASSEPDIEMACLNGCDGIGLIRIENIYLRSKILPNEQYLVRQFTLLAEKTGGRAITLRLLDIGGDKKLPYLDIEAEDDNFLGLRGVRFLIRYENILKAQLRAIYIISKKYPIRILIPMVTLPFEIQHIRDIADVCRQELAKEHNDVFPIVPIGVMIETPAAVVNIKEIVKVSDFISIGTNDLIQYTMASSRENTSVAHYYEKGAAVIMDFIRQCIVAANEQGIECGICGEMAGDERWIEQLIKLGVRQVSVAPHRIPLLKEEIRNISVQ